MIEKNSAELHTATVALKMITVNQRQMTLSVFRQLPHNPIIDSTSMKLKGVPWGWVNYFWPDIKLPFERGSKVQVVWQCDKVLYRSIVFLLPSFDVNSWYDIIEDDDKGNPARWSHWFPECLLDNIHRVLNDRKSETQQDREQLKGLPLILYKQEAVLEKKIESVMNRPIQALEQYNNLVANLMNLEQLFIAVGGGGKSA